MYAIIYMYWMFYHNLIHLLLPSLVMVGLCIVIIVDEIYMVFELYPSYFFILSKIIFLWYEKDNCMNKIKHCWLKPIQ